LILNVFELDLAQFIGFLLTC